MYRLIFYLKTIYIYIKCVCVCGGMRLCVPACRQMQKANYSSNILTCRNCVSLCGSQSRINLQDFILHALASEPLYHEKTRNKTDYKHTSATPSFLLKIKFLSDLLEYCDGIKKDWNVI